MFSDLKFLAGSVAAIAAIFSMENSSIQASSRHLLMMYETLQTEDGGRSPSQGGRSRLNSVDSQTERHPLTSQGYSPKGSQTGSGHYSPPQDAIDLANILRSRAEKAHDIEEDNKKDTAREEYYLQISNEEERNSDEFARFESQYSKEEFPHTTSSYNNVSKTAALIKTIGFGSLVAGLTFSVLALTGNAPFTGMGFLVILGLCITVGLATQVLGNKVESGGALRALMVGATGAAITLSLCMTHTANSLAESNPAQHAELVLQSNQIFAGAAFFAVIVVIVLGMKLLGPHARLKANKENLGVALAAIGMLGLAFTTLPAAGAATSMADATPIVTLVSLFILLGGLAFFACGFLNVEKYKVNGGLKLAVSAILFAGLGVVVGAAFPVFGGEALHPIGTEIMQYSGIAFVGLLATMCIFFTYKFCLYGKPMKQDKGFGHLLLGDA